MPTFQNASFTTSCLIFSICQIFADSFVFCFTVENQYVLILESWKLQRNTENQGKECPSPHPPARGSSVCVLLRPFFRAELCPIVRSAISSPFFLCFLNGGSGAPPHIAKVSHKHQTAAGESGVQTAHSFRLSSVAVFLRPEYEELSGPRRVDPAGRCSWSVPFLVKNKALTIKQ